MASPIQYAQLPTYNYHSFGGQFRYQTFDRSTAQFSYHPVSADILTTDNQDNKTDSPEAEKEQAPEGTQKDEPSSSTDDAPSTEAAGTY